MEHEWSNLRHLQPHDTMDPVPPMRVFEARGPSLERAQGTSEADLKQRSPAANHSAWRKILYCTTCQTSLDGQLRRMKPLLRPTSTRPRLADCSSLHQCALQIDLNKSRSNGWKREGWYRPWVETALLDLSRFHIRESVGRTLLKIVIAASDHLPVNAPFENANVKQVPSIVQRGGGRGTSAKSTTSWLSEQADHGFLRSARSLSIVQSCSSERS